MSEESGRVVRIERTFAAPAEEVFDAWTSPEVMRRWFHCDPAWDNPSRRGRSPGGREDPRRDAQTRRHRSRSAGHLHPDRPAAPAGDELDLRRRSLERAADRALLHRSPRVRPPCCWSTAASRPTNAATTRRRAGRDAWPNSTGCWSGDSKHAQPGSYRSKRKARAPSAGVRTISLLKQDRLSGFSRNRRASRTHDGCRRAERYRRGGSVRSS